MVEQINGISNAGLSALFQAEGLKRFLVRGTLNAIVHPISGEFFFCVPDHFPSDSATLLSLNAFTFSFCSSKPGFPPYS